MSTTFTRGENPLKADKLNTAFSERIWRGGDTMQGILRLVGDPVAPFDAATKQYVDRLAVPPQGATGPAGPAGPPGPVGPPGSLSGGGTVTGPLIYTATGGNTPRSAQDRAAEHYSALDFDMLCNGVTDEGALLNAALLAIPPGTTLFVPGSVYTTQTILVRDGRRIEMPPGTLFRPVPNDNATWLPSHGIIGSPTLSPVVLVFSGTQPNGGLTNVQITRNGTPAAGTIGLQCLGANQKHWRVYSWNHARGIQCGALRSAPVLGVYHAITTAFDHCAIWRCYEDWLYLLNAPETTCFDMRFGINGSVDPAGSTSLVTIDGDLLSQDAATTNTVTFLRCQFNTGGLPQYTIRFIQYASLDGLFILDACYSGGVVQAFVFVDPNCTIVRNLNILGCSIQPMQATQTLITDAGKRLAALSVIGNHTSTGSASPPGLSLSGIDAQIIGNRFGGSFLCILDAMTHGQFTSNTSNEIRFTGVYAGSQPFLVTGNTFATIVQTATGLINYLEPFGNYDSQITVGRTNAAGRVNFRRGTDGLVHGAVGVLSATGGGVVELYNDAGTPIVRMNAANVGGACVFQVNALEVARHDPMGLTIARQSGNTAPGAGFARLAFVNGTTAGTAKLIAIAGTSTAAVTIMDNIGAGF